MSFGILGNLAVLTYKFPCKIIHISFLPVRMDEMAEFDVPAMIDFVLKSTNRSKLHHISFSLTTATILAGVYCIFWSYRQWTIYANPRYITPPWIQLKVIFFRPVRTKSICWTHVLWNPSSHRALSKKAILQHTESDRMDASNFA